MVITVFLGFNLRFMCDKILKFPWRYSRFAEKTTVSFLQPSWLQNYVRLSTVHKLINAFHRFEGTKTNAQNLQDERPFKGIFRRKGSLLESIKFLKV